MRKKPIIILFILSIFLGLGAIALVLGTGALASATYQSCSDTYNTCANYAPDTTTTLYVGLLGGAGLGLLAWIFYMLAWIGALVKQSKREQWAWFVCTLIFGGFCLLVYLIAVPETPPYAVPLSIPDYLPGQQPPTQYPSPYQQPYENPPASTPWHPY